MPEMSEKPPAYSNYPDVSVLMATNTIDRFFFEAVESIFFQTFVEWELVLVLNGNAYDADISLHDRRITIIRSRARSLSASLTIGANACRARYIARMDADDVSCPERILTQYRFLEGHPTIDFVGSWAQEIDETGKATGRVMRPPCSPRAVEYALSRFCPIIHPSVMFRVSAYDAAGGYGMALFGEDYDLWQRFALKRPFCGANIGRPLLKYRKHSAQVTNTISKQIRTLYNAFLVMRFAMMQRRLWKVLVFFIPRSIYLRLLRIVWA